jgi:hypothetical protein
MATEIKQVDNRFFIDDPKGGYGNPNAQWWFDLPKRLQPSHPNWVKGNRISRFRCRQCGTLHVINKSDDCDGATCCGVHYLFDHGVLVQVEEVMP